MAMAAEVAHPVLTENQAQELTAKIYGHIDMAWELIKKAYYGRADKALGYESWDDYCKGEFHGAQLRLPLDKRREVVKTLTEAGLSTRAIASATGASRPTVTKDQKAQVGNIGPVAKVPGLDGKIRTPKAPNESGTTTGGTVIVIDGTFVNEPPPGPAPAVAAPKDSRPALVRKADDVAWNLRKAVESVAMIRTNVDYHVHEGQIKISLVGAIEYAKTILATTDDW